MTTPEYLRALIGRLGISQRKAAALIGISERQMRSYLADPGQASTAIAAPAYVGLALEAIACRLQTTRGYVTTALVADYLTADHGQWMAVFRDGTWRIFDAGESPGRDLNCLAMLKCPGIWSLDRSLFTDDFCSWDDEAGAYVVTGRNRDSEWGRVVGDLADVIRECCRDGDVTGFAEDLEAAMERAALEAMESPRG